MGASKTQAFGEWENKVAMYAKALSHPARVSILNFMVENKNCICGDLVDALPLAQATVSQHLRELKNAGLITGEIDPPRVCYCLNEEAWNELNMLFSNLFGKVKSSCV